jgi:hypothetical protein
MLHIYEQNIRVVQICMEWSSEKAHTNIAMHQKISGLHKKEIKINGFQKVLKHHLN